MKNTTSWERLVIMVNKLKDKGGSLTNECLSKMCVKEYYSISTMNNYKNQLKRLGYLKRIKPCQYKIIKKIPNSLNSNKAWKLLSH